MAFRVSPPTFAYTRQSVCLLEKVSVCVSRNEPVLLVGETGTGKTSSVQFLAHQLGELAGASGSHLWVGFSAALNSNNNDNDAVYRRFGGTHGQESGENPGFKLRNSRYWTGWGRQHYWQLGYMEIEVRIGAQKTMLVVWPLNGPSGWARWPGWLRGWVL